MTKVKVTIESQRFVTNKSFVSHDSKINQENLMKIHKKIKQNEKVCRAQNLGSHARTRARSQSNIKYFLLTNCMSRITKHC